MVKLGLFLQAELDGVTGVSPIDTTDKPYFYTFKVQCNSCHEINDNWITISRQVCIAIRSWETPNALGEGHHEREQRRGKFCMEMQKLPGMQACGICS